MDAELRKHQHTIAAIGVGAVLFGIWSVIKTIIYAVLLTPLGDTVEQQLPEADIELKGTALLLASIALGLALLVDLTMRAYVGKRAWDIGNGVRQIGATFCIAVCIVALFDCIEFVTGTLSILDAEEISLDQLVTLLVDITSFVTMIQMLAAVYKVSKLTKKSAGDLSGGVSAASGIMK